MLAGELALAGINVVIVERRASQDLAGSRAGGLHSRTIEVLDLRGIADRFLSQGQVYPVVHFHIPLDISDFPTRHNYVLGLWQNHIERILADWVGELAVTIYRERDVTGFAQDDTGADVGLSDGQSLRAEYLVGCDGGRSLIRKAAGIEFTGWDPTTSWLTAEVEMAEEPKWGFHQDALGRMPDLDLVTPTARCGSSWLEDSFKPAVRINDRRQYAYHWYLSDALLDGPEGRRREHMIAAFGNGGQRLFVFPGLDLVVVVTAGNYNSPDQGVGPARVLNDFVLPNLR
jgi:2-polyprenyl-6-methoxyphenol hydroxylase-like FAD-dependent oxidoreductase